MDERSRISPAFLVLFFIACGGSSSGSALQGTCGQQTTADGNVRCLDARATTASAIASVRDVTCGSAQWSSGSCPPADRLGGCLSVSHQSSDGATIQEIYWYYPSPSIQTAADVMNTCVAGIETFVPADGGFPAF